MFKKLSKNLNLLMAEARLNAEELSRRIGLPASTIKKIRNNHDANPTLTTLVPLAKYFSMTISQLVGDESFPKSRLKGTYCPNLDTLSYIPLISWRDAINWPSLNTKSDISIGSEHIYSQKAYALMVEEDGWENLVKNTALLIDPELEIEHRDFIIVYKSGQKLPALKQALLDEGKIYLKSVIQGYNLAILTPEHKLLGVVVEYKKHLRKASDK